jgi:hypothetical protein
MDQRAVAVLGSTTAALTVVADMNLTLDLSIFPTCSSPPARSYSLAFSVDGGGWP